VLHLSSFSHTAKINLLKVKSTIMTLLFSFVNENFKSFCQNKKAPSKHSPRHYSNIPLFLSHVSTFSVLQRRCLRLSFDNSSTLFRLSSDSLLTLLRPFFDRSSTIVRLPSTDHYLTDQLRIYIATNLN
jgi:hypothetical protein